MPDTPADREQGSISFARFSLKAALAQGGFASSPFSHLLGLMGEQPWFRNNGTNRGWFARVLAMAAAPLHRRRKSRDRASYNRTLVSIGVLDRWPAEQAGPARYLSATVMVAMAAGVCLVVQPFLAAGSLVLPFLIAIMLSAIAYGLLPSLLASVLSLLTFDFLFLPPIYSLNISEPDDVMRVLVFALAAAIVSNLAAYARDRAVAARLRAEVAEDLYRFGRQLAGAATLPEVLAAALPRLTAMLRAPVLIILPDDGGLAIFPACPKQGSGVDPGRLGPAPTGPALTDPALTGPALTGPALTGMEFANVKSWLQNDAPADASTDGPDPVSPRWLFVPMRTGQGKVGVMAVAREALDSLEAANDDALFGTLADLLAQTIHRIDLTDDLLLANRAAEREELHAALLASLSHDLRTPLASVLAAAESLVDYRDLPGEDSQQALARSIQGEARRLDRYIGDLLDMSRLETGLADAAAGRVDLVDAVSVALDRCAACLANHRVAVEMAQDLPLVRGDEVLLEHVLFNLLSNAAKYTPAGTLIQLRALREEDRVRIEIIDEGYGIRPADLDRIFDKFYRGKRQGPQSPGIGLGLAICRGYVAAMGGRIAARNRTDRGGAVFTVTLPVPAPEYLPDLDS